MTTSTTPTPITVWVDFNSQRQRTDGAWETITDHDIAGLTLRQPVIADDGDGLRCQGFISALCDYGRGQFALVELLVNTIEPYRPEFDQDAADEAESMRAAAARDEDVAAVPAGGNQ